MDLGKLGVWSFFDAMPAVEAAGAARRIESLGYGALWIPEAVGREAMAHAALARSKFQCAVPTLELKMSFLEAAGPGIVTAEGRVIRWGGSVGFLDGDIRDEKGRLIVHATSTIKIVRPKK